MDEPPGVRLRVALSALTMAEYFRDEEKQDVLLFIDNIFRFSQAIINIKKKRNEKKEEIKKTNRKIEGEHRKPSTRSRKIYAKKNSKTPRNERSKKNKTEATRWDKKKREWRKQE